MFFSMGLVYSLFRQASKVFWENIFLGNPIYYRSTIRDYEIAGGSENDFQASTCI